jgi:hypothetical protein
MNRLYCLIIVFAVSASTAFSQQATSNCTQVLRLVRSTYEQGRLHELPAMTEGCLKAAEGKGFTKEEKKEAYRYLTLAYIYLEEPDKADESMLKLLETEHFFEVNPAIDPAEFVALYNKFRHDPLFRYGIKIGGNVTTPNVSQYYNIGSTAGGMGTYTLAGNIQITAMFEKDFPKINKMLVLAPEIGWVNRNYGYENPNLGVSDGGSIGTGSVSNQVFAIKQSWLDLNAIVQYKLESTIQRQLYVGLGPGASMLLSSTNQASTTIGTGANKYTVTGPAVDDSKSYNKFVYSVTLVAGAKLKVGELYLNADIRYQYGFSNVVNSATRTNPEIAYDYQGRYNDYRMSNIMVNIGVLIPNFSPKKLIK